MEKLTEKFEEKNPFQSSTNLIIPEGVNFTI